MGCLLDIQMKVMDDAICCIPIPEKQAYLEAMERAPHLVWSETDPSYYLRFEEYDAWKAAKRLVNYWQWKKKLFGEKMFRSIFDVSEGGSLEKQELDLLRAGALVKLDKDINGNSVFLFDRSRVSIGFELVEKDLSSRVLFYTYALLANEQKEAGTGSVILLNVVRSLPKFYKNIKDYYAIMWDILPLRPKIHSLFLTNSTFASFFIQLVIPAVQRHQVAYWPVTASLCFNLCCSEDEALDKVAYLGLPSSSLPACLGGTWKYESFLNWLNQQASANMPVVTSPWQSEEAMNTQQLSHFHNESSLKLSQHIDYSQNPVVTNESKQMLNIDYRSSPVVNISHGVFIHVNYPTPQLCVDVPSSDFNGMYQRVTPTNHELASQLMIRQIPVPNSSPLAPLNECSLVKLISSLFSENADGRMDQSGYGAFTADDFATLKTGFLMILSNDRNGAAVLQLELFRAKTCSLESQRRCCWFMLSILSKRCNYSPIDIIILAFVKDIEQGQLQHQTSFIDILQAFQIYLRIVHVFYQGVGLGWLSYQRDAQIMFQKLLGLTEDLTITHILDEFGDFDVDEFCIEHNFERKKLPKTLGGEWTRKSFQKWLEHQILLENCTTSALATFVTGNISSCDELTRSSIFDSNYIRYSEQGVSKTMMPNDVLPSLVPDCRDDFPDDSSFMSIHSDIFDQN